MPPGKSQVASDSKRSLPPTHHLHRRARLCKMRTNLTVTAIRVQASHPLRRPCSRRPTSTTITVLPISPRILLAPTWPEPSLDFAGPISVFPPPRYTLSLFFYFYFMPF